jgi:hypothetical protein
VMNIHIYNIHNILPLVFSFGFTFCHHTPSTFSASPCADVLSKGLF